MLKRTLELMREVNKNNLRSIKKQLSFKNKANKSFGYRLYINSVTSDGYLNEYCHLFLNKNNKNKRVISLKNFVECRFSNHMESKTNYNTSCKLTYDTKDCANNALMSHQKSLLVTDFQNTVKNVIEIMKQKSRLSNYLQNKHMSKISFKQKIYELLYPINLEIFLHKEYAKCNRKICKLLEKHRPPREKPPWKSQNKINRINYKSSLNH